MFRMNLKIVHQISQIVHTINVYLDQTGYFNTL